MTECHRTCFGRVVYNRKKHPFTHRRLLKIGRGLQVVPIPLDSSRYPIVFEAIYEKKMTTLFGIPLPIEGLPGSPTTTPKDEASSGSALLVYRRNDARFLPKPVNIVGKGV